MAKARSLQNVELPLQRPAFQELVKDGLLLVMGAALVDLGQLSYSWSEFSEFSEFLDLGDLVIWHNSFEVADKIRNGFPSQEPCSNCSNPSQEPSSQEPCSNCSNPSQEPSFTGTLQ